MANGQEGEGPAATSVPPQPQPQPPTSPPLPPTTTTAPSPPPPTATAPSPPTTTTTTSIDFVTALTHWSERANDEDDDEQSEKPTAPLSPKPSPSSTATAAPNIGAANSGSIVVNRSAIDGFAVITKPAHTDTHLSVADVLGLPMEGGEAGVGRDTVGEGSRRRGVSPIVRRWNREKVLRRAGLAFRVCGLLFSLVSFSVMAADKTQGWSGDSFYRYKEYRYVISVAVITFAYSTLQLAAHLYQFATGKPAIRRPLSLYIDFACDQVLAYLLMSASSSAASLTDDTQAEWGKDPFTDLASGSVSISFLAFAALALSSLISGYHVYNQNNLW
ncbi:CASP-like protein 4A3 [Nymphaea colorata]|nr:CASP-like protein 4A3 [Nymphaea colorata]